MMLIEILTINKIPILGILDKDRNKVGKNLQGITILGGDDKLPELKNQASWFVIGLGGVGNNIPRQKLFEYALSQGFRPLTVIHPSAIISHWAKIGSGCQLMPSCIVNAGAQLGINTIINSGAIVEHDCVIGNHVHIATNATLASGIRVGDGSHVGAGSTIRQCLQIGENAVIGAGAVVVKDVPANTTVIGVPAKEIMRGKS